MKKLRVAGFIVLDAALCVVFLWRNLVSFPDWAIRENAILLCFAVPHGLRYKRPNYSVRRSVTGNRYSR
jgi:hypothetical protein